MNELCAPGQVYVGLWSHADRRAGHIHYVVQPVDIATMERHDAYGPRLQALMFDHDDPPDPTAIEEFATRARDCWARDWRS